jgi:hypothetical protein
MMLLDELSNQEIAILQATKASYYGMSATDLALYAETNVASAQETLAILAEKEILVPYEEYDGTICYCFPDNEISQTVYDELYGPLEV